MVNDIPYDAPTLQKALQAYGLTEVTVVPLGTGLINHTWKTIARDGTYVLQRINTAVFQQPEAITQNIRLIGDYLKEKFPDHLFVRPVPTTDGEDMIRLSDDNCYRLAPFVENSQTIEVVESPSQAFEAAKQFGRFTRLLSEFPLHRLQTTIPHFHDLNFRYQQFEKALSEGNRQRIMEVKASIVALKDQSTIVTHYNSGILRHAAFKQRVMHHDAKISNVLFDESGKGLCVIDLDTVMPGHFISDVGDMMRTYLSPVSEEEKYLSAIEVRTAFYKAIMEGYASEMKEELTAAEKDQFLFAGQCMIYMQALRFLTDYLNDDRYYKADYKEHNLVRAQNQLALLKDFTKKQKELKSCFAF